MVVADQLAAPLQDQLAYNYKRFVEPQHNVTVSFIGDAIHT